MDQLKLKHLDTAGSGAVKKENIHGCVGEAINEANTRRGHHWVERKQHAVQIDREPITQGQRNRTKQQLGCAVQILSRRCKQIEWKGITRINVVPSDDPVRRTN
jgi:hypothetical protein